MIQKKSLKKQLEAEAKKYAKANAAGDKRVQEAVVYGGEWWCTHAGQSMAEYEDDLTKAYIEKYGDADLGIRLQIRKTSRLWHTRDRLAAELDNQDSFIRMAQGSMKQMKYEIDPRLLLLEKYERDLTNDLTAIGLNFTASNAKPNQPSDDEDDAMLAFYKNAKK